MDEVLTELLPKFNKVLEVVRQDLATIRTGKATPQLIENLLVEVYGTRMKLMELSTIATVDPTTLIVTPFDVGNVAALATAIQNANLGLTAVIEDVRVRVVVPPLSEERRNEYTKLAKTKIEGGKVMLRQVRHEAMETIGKSSADEDTKKRQEKEVQAAIDNYVEKFDFMLAEKEKELLTI